MALSAMSRLSGSGDAAETESGAYLEVARVCRAAHAAFARRDAHALRTLLSPHWHVKSLGDGATALMVTARDQLLETIDRATPVPEPVEVSGVQLCFGQLAIVRTEYWAMAQSSIHTLLKDGARGWTLIGEARLHPAHARRAARFDPALATPEALAVLDRYYRAVTDGEPAPLEDIFDAGWHMKNHEFGEIVCEDKAAFIKRIEPGPLPGYSDNRQIADVQVIADQIAYVRVDRPSTPSTTIFVLFRVGGRWVVSDKVWADGRIGAAATVN